MQVYLAVTPSEAQRAVRFRRPLAHVAYSIGESSTLLRQNLLGCLLCSLLALIAIDTVRILTRMFWGNWELGAMLSLAGREILISLIFVFPVYALFLWVYRRVPKKTVL